MLLEVLLPLVIRREWEEEREAATTIMAEEVKVFGMWIALTVTEQR